MDALSIQGNKPTLLTGARGAAVAQAQQILKDKGYYQGRIDGDFGKGTKAAVEAFQNANGLQVDGKVGIKTWQKLDAVAIAPVVDAVTATTDAPVPTPTFADMNSDSPLLASSAVSLFIPSSIPPSTTATSSIAEISDGTASDVPNMAIASPQANPPEAVMTITSGQINGQPIAISLEAAANIYARSQSPQQTAAIDKLQANIPPELLKQFLQRWQIASEQTNLAPSLSTAMGGYNMQQMLNQNLALQWLQGQIMPQVLEQFRLDWANPSAANLGLTNTTPFNLVTPDTSTASESLINLTQAVTDFRRSPSQVTALETLQRSVTPAKMQQFFQRWTVASSQNAIAISLLDVFKDYDLDQHPNQLDALQWLEKELTFGQLKQFSQDWLAQ
jgi:hypothetical protein